jgi:TrmH family RNA methyltransferase
VLVVEGPLLVREAAEAGWAVEVQFLAPGAQPAVDGPACWLAEGVLERVSSTEHPQPVLAIVERRSWRFADLESGHPDRPLLVLAGVGDPGNAGTILRSAEAAGIIGVVTTPGSVDLSNPKVVRASAGALFHVPTVEDVEPADLRLLRRRLIGASASGSVSYLCADLVSAVALVVGNEAHGIADDVPIVESVRIDHEGRAESLNVAMAATVLCFEALRQRRSRSGTS